jgi:peptidoglycan/xylan/chitin deacetylase (PgdA/CDA1 family)
LKAVALTTQALLLAGALMLGACGSQPAAPPGPPPPAVAAPAPKPDTVRPAPVAAANADADARPGARGQVAGRSDRLLVYLPESGDTLAAMAARFLGNEQLAWRIADANGAAWQAAPGVPVIVPLAAPNPMGISSEGVQTVPILCYHRFGAGQSKMIVSPAQFEAQLEWLARNQFRVLRLADLQGFLAAREALPQRSVVITIDDGYESVYRHAYPSLKKFGFSATLFVYSDFVGARDGLSWAQLQEMAASGVIDIQAHSKSHRNLVERFAAETDAGYRSNIEAEVRQPREVLERRLAPAGVRVRHYAYPFGDANEWVLENLQRHGYELGVTVNPGGNPFFAHPFMLRRTMIFGDHTLEDFAARLQVRRPLGRP